MTSTERSRGRRRRAARVAAVFAAGAVVGGAVLAGVWETTSSPGTTTTASPAASVTGVARSARYDASAIYRRTSAGVVDITVTQSAGTAGVSPFGPGGGTSTAEGSGFVIDEQGHIVTAEHVVDGARTITVHFKDGTSAKATLVGSDPSTDLAVIDVDVPASGLTPLTLGSSAAVEPGDGVVAIGSPFGYADSITAGIVSAVDRAIQAPNGFSISGTIQTDAAINHGNSGGPLIDEAGEVIGVNVQIATGDDSSGSQNAGVGFAVPSDTVKTVAADLIAGREVEHAYLGVSVGDDGTRAGALVGAVRAGSPAAAAGLRAGDLVTAVDGEKVVDAGDLTAAVNAHRPGETVTLVVSRDSASRTVTVVLGSRPATSS